MANNDRIRVAGYAQRVYYTDGIEYRNFTPDLVGLQLTSDGGTPLFTMGGFSVTTNIDPKISKIYNTTSFSNFITLADIDLTVQQTQTLLDDNANVILNLDRSKLDYYALFGSLTEFVRVALENVIINWPASLYVTPVSQDINGNTINGFTVENYTYDTLSEISSFKINTNFINNKFQIVYTNNGTLTNTFNSSNNLRNLTLNYNSYVVLFNNIEYDLINFTASTYEKNDYVYLQVKGNPFSGNLSTYNFYYHIKPKKIIEETFFNTLPDFEYYLLNRNITPAYTASFTYPLKSDTGIILYVTDTVTWPVSDGYNIDFDTTDYGDYASKLFDISSANDLTSSNLMGRFLVSESITSFDTTPLFLSDLDQDDTGQKINKTLQIYGVEFDKINQFITGIEFANTVTYNRQNNTPDVYLKNLARVLGWDLVSSILENNLLANYVTTSPSTYSGQTVGLTAVEADTELWRRLILNTPWLWKSKGARKSIEFLLRFIGAPMGLFTFNEYVYRAAAPLDVDLFRQILTLNGLNDDISLYPIDNDGYPRPFANTDSLYFQSDGLWFRETGGTGSTIDILTGNNPHVGPYDGGNRYLRQFETLIPSFTPVLLSSVTSVTDVENLYTNYESGTFENVSTATTVDTVQITTGDNTDIGDCVVFIPTIEADPNPSTVLNDCGCDEPQLDNIMSLCLNSSQRVLDPCKNLISYTDNIEQGLYEFNYAQFNFDGSVYVDVNNQPIYNTTNYANQECCTKIGGTPIIHYDIENGQTTNTGYFCCNNTGKCGCTIACDWMVQLSSITLPQDIGVRPRPQYLGFTQPNSAMSMVTTDGCHCIGNPYTVLVPNVVDPYTGQVGVGCQLTQTGINDLALGPNQSVIYNYYLNRSNGNTSCYPNNDNNQIRI